MNALPLVLIWQPNGARDIGDIVHNCGLITQAINSISGLAARYDGRRPCCIICDLAHFDELNKLLKDLCPPPSIIAITPPTNIAPVVRAIQEGATTVLDMSCSREELNKQIERAIEVWSDSAEKHRFAQRLKTLTESERTVLDGMLSGLTNKEIAAAMGQSLRTIETRRHHIFAKTETTNFAELIARCVKGSIKPRLRATRQRTV